MTMTARRYEVKAGRAHVRCTGTYHGSICDWLLTKVCTDTWEVDMASEAELVCEHCGKRYTLAEYK